MSTIANESEMWKCVGYHRIIPMLFNIETIEWKVLD